MLLNEIEALRAAAARLASQPVMEIAPGNEGANSRIYRVKLATSFVALKIYPHRPEDDRDRLETEWNTLTFLRSRGVDTVPAPIARDDDKRLMLMEWIDGEIVVHHRRSELDHALSFIKKIFELSDDPDARQFKLASEACLSAAVILRQIEVRLENFEEYQTLAKFLSAEFQPALAVVREHVAAELAEQRDLAPELRRLIPADFGFHNTLRQPDGRLRYIDFDYFGWDDPVKLTADFILHPAMQLSASDKAQVARQMTAARAADPDFSARLIRHLPLYALRWALILLNPFRRDRKHLWLGNESRRDVTLSSQIGKARLALESGHALV
jgi:hypothetical protein